MIWEILGSLFLLKYGITLSQFLWMMIRLYFLPRLGMKKDLKKYGSWAVVTGATDGIGKAIAKQLAKRGINVVLISRSTDKLKAVAEEFDIFNVEVKTITYDFSDANNYEKIEKGLQDLDVGILVNNVGTCYDYPLYLLELQSEFYDRLININVNSVHKMTRMVLDGMTKRKRGLIVHVSSCAGVIPIPLVTVYSASKAFVTFFGKALQYEYANIGIHNQVLTPYMVASNMSHRSPNGIFVPSADRYAQMAVDAFALSSSMTGWWAHEIQAFFQCLLPNAKLFQYMVAARNRCLHEEQQKED